MNFLLPLTLLQNWPVGDNSDKMPQSKKSSQWCDQCIDYLKLQTQYIFELFVHIAKKICTQCRFDQWIDNSAGTTFWHWLPSSFASGRATQQYFVCSPYFRFVPIIPIHSTNSHHMLSFKRVACLWLGQHSTCQSTSLTLTPHSRAISTNHYFASMGTATEKDHRY